VFNTAVKGEIQKSKRGQTRAAMIARAFTLICARAERAIRS
jgi:hypothetical protein